MPYRIPKHETHEPKTHMIVIDLPYDAYEKLSALAYENEMTMTDICMDMISHGRKSKIEKPERVEQRQFAFKVPESFYKTITKDAKSTSFKRLRPWARAIILRCLGDLK